MTLSDFVWFFGLMTSVEINAIKKPKRIAMKLWHLYLLKRLFNDTFLLRVRTESMINDKHRRVANAKSLKIRKRNQSQKQNEHFLLNYSIWLFEYVTLSNSKQKNGREEKVVDNGHF